MACAGVLGVLAAILVSQGARTAAATPPKAIIVAPGSPEPTPSPAFSAPPLSLPTGAPPARIAAAVPRLSRDEGTGCGKRFQAPVDGKLALRSAYRRSTPHTYMACPSWSAFGKVRGGHRFHGGIDIAAPTGTPIRAAVDGALSYAHDPGGFGLFARVRFAHPKRGRDGACSGSTEIEIVYAHLIEEKGRRAGPERAVRAGEVIGHVGCTGNAKGMCSPSPESHVHVTVQRTDGSRTRFDPMAFLGWSVSTPTDQGDMAACGK